VRRRSPAASDRQESWSGLCDAVVVDPEREQPPVTVPAQAARERVRALVGPTLGFVLLAVAFWVLRRELRAYHLDDVLEHLRAISRGRLATAGLLTVAGYASLTGYDTLAFRYLGNRLPYRRIALSSFVAYVFSHNAGGLLLGGSAVRYRMLSSWGVKGEDVVRVVAFTAFTLWTGFCLLGGVVYALWPLPLWLPVVGATSSRPLGWLLLAALASYLCVVTLRRRPFHVRGIRIAVPPARITVAQFALSTLDWSLAAAVFYVLLPSAPGLTVPVVLGAFLLSQIAGILSTVPAGLGVFETSIVVLLARVVPADELLASILAYRFVYYLLPLVCGVVLFVGFELRERRAGIAKAGARIQGWIGPLVPRVFAATTFLAGALLLVSGAAPELPERLEWLQRVLPLPLVEISKLLGSVVGVGLLVLANALRERVDAAYLGTLVLLLAGAVASLVKGLAWEQAAVLLAMAIVLLPCHGFFDRRSSLLGRPLSRDWWLAVAVVAAGTLITLELAYRHVEYSNELWWRMGFDAQAPRSLRALLGAGVALAAVGALQLLRPAPPVPSSPSREDLDRAQAITGQSRRTHGYLALLGDKNLLFHEDGRAFLMYAVVGRTWVALGDAIGPEADQEELAWRFVELADRHGARAVFYEVGEDTLPIYLDLGLELRKLGEEGRVPLGSFSLEGGARKGLRQVYHRALRDGLRFEIVPAAGVAPLVGELEAISNAWLATKHTREKRFSVGFFDRDYLLRLPIALVHRDDRIVAFANLWPSDAKYQLSIDLMRHVGDAPGGVMEYLFVELMSWARDQGYQYYSLGLAPLSGLESRRLSPVWDRAGAILFQHGEWLYGFRGLRAFKEKFHPQWAPRYLAAPGGLEMALVLTRIASLISGGVTGVLAK